MFAKHINDIQELPVADKDRKCTDVLCTILPAIFALTLFILSFCLYKPDNYYKVNYPTDSDLRLCQRELPGYPFVYFTNPSAEDPLKNRVCVSVCPKASDTYLMCSPTSKLSCQTDSGITIYDSTGDVNRLGGYCIPSNPTFKDRLDATGALKNKWNFMNYWDLVRLSLLFSFFVGLGYMLFVQCCPQAMVRVAVVLASALFLAFGLILLIDNNTGWNGYNGWRIFLGIILILLAILFATVLYFYRTNLTLAGIFLKNATRFLSENWYVALYIPLFLAFTIGLVVLCVWQYVAFSTAYTPDMQPGDIYYRSNDHDFWQVLNAFEFIWGLQFLRDAFNLVVSGNAVEWYFSHKPTNCGGSFKRLLRRNFGSVAGGSLLNSLFTIPSVLFEILKCQRRGQPSCCNTNNLCRSACCCCDSLFQLVRSDVYAYINLTGIPYCNSARNCEYLCHRNNLFVGSHSSLQLYRFAANWVNTAIVMLICYCLMKGRSGDVGVAALLLIGLFAICISQYFVGIHADAAQGLQVSFFTEYELEGMQYGQMSRCPPYLRKEVEEFDRSIVSIN